MAREIYERLMIFPRTSILGMIAFEEPDKGGSGGGEGGDDGIQKPNVGEDGIVPPAKGSNDDGGEGGDDKGGEGGDYTAPDFIPEHMRGKDADDTLEKLFKGYEGARKKIAQGGGNNDDPAPDNLDGYTFTDNGDEENPDKVYAELTSEQSKDFVDLAKATAKDMGLGPKQFDGFMRKFVENAAAKGIPVGQTTEEAEAASGEAELEHLVEMYNGNKREAYTVANTVINFGQKLFDSNQLSEAEHKEFGIMVGTAESIQLFHKIMTGQFGEKAIPLPSTDTSAGSLSDVRQRHADALAMAPGPDRDAAIQKAEADLKKVMGGKKTGAVKTDMF